MRQLSMGLVTMLISKFYQVKKRVVDYKIYGSTELAKLKFPQEFDCVFESRISL